MPSANISLASALGSRHRLRVARGPPDPHSGIDTSRSWPRGLHLSRRHPLPGRRKLWQELGILMVSNFAAPQIGKPDNDPFRYVMLIGASRKAGERPKPLKRSAVARKNQRGTVPPATDTASPVKVCAPPCAAGSMSTCCGPQHLPPSRPRSVHPPDSIRQSKHSTARGAAIQWARSGRMKHNLTISSFALRWAGTRPSRTSPKHHRIALPTDRRHHLSNAPQCEMPLALR